MLRRSFSLVSIPLVAWSASSCALLTVQEESPRLVPGMRVEVEGELDDLRTATEVDEKDPDDDLEVTAPLQPHEGGSVQQLGIVLELSEKLGFENEDKEDVPPFPLEPGTWLRSKSKAEDSEPYRVRTLRQHEEQDRWEVEGIVTAVDGAFPGDSSGGFSVGPYTFEVDEKTDFTLFDEAGDWRDFFKRGPLAQRATKEQKFLPFSVPLGDRARIGGQIASEAVVENDYDLDRRDERDKTKLESSFQLAVIARVGEQGFFTAEFETKLEFDLKERRANERDLTVEPQEIYFYLPVDVLEGLAVQVGRQDLDETREWLYDETVDALRLYYDRGRLQLEASLSKTPHLLETSRELPVTNLVGVATWSMDDRWRLSGYFLDRRSHDVQEFSPFLYGVRSYAKADAGQFGHWAELSRADGLIEGRRLRGWAFDAGGTYVLDHDHEPSLTLGWARGSGGRRSDNTDRNYRQSGLQDNNGKWNGVTSFRYYGELIDPELSNLSVSTLGAGIRIRRDLSLDLVAHGYRQVSTRSTSLFSDLDRQPNGRSKNLGREYDLILGYRGARMTSELIAARFEPGRGFDDDGAAWLTAFQLRFKF